MMRYGVLGALKAELGMRGLPVGPPRTPNTLLNAEQQTALRRDFDALDFLVE